MEFGHTIDLSLKRSSDIGLLKLPDESMPLLHLQTQRHIGRDKYITTSLPAISDMEGFSAKELSIVLFKEGLEEIQVSVHMSSMPKNSILSCALKRQTRVEKICKLVSHLIVVFRTRQLHGGVQKKWNSEICCYAQ